MPNEDQVLRGRAFRQLHEGPAFLLPNAWDAMSALILSEAGFPAVATTSGGVSWALGRSDGERTPWPEVAGAVERIASAVRVPVSADIEAGYANDLQQLQEHVVQVIEAGAVGFNIEDRHGERLRDLPDACARIAAARMAADSTGVPVTVNARTDVFSLGPANETSENEARRRIAAYLEAGASCIFLFGLSDLVILERLAVTTPAPINVVGRAGGPDFAALTGAGAKRVSVAAGLALHAYGVVRSAATRLRQTSDFECLRSDFNRAQAQAMTSSVDRKGK